MHKMHQEMPKGNINGQMHGFQLWANLPSSHKLISPRYQDIKSKEIPLLEDNDGSKIPNKNNKTGLVLKVHIKKQLEDGILELMSNKKKRKLLGKKYEYGNRLDWCWKYG